MSSYDEAVERVARQTLSETEPNMNEVAEAALKQGFLDNLPSTDNLLWDKAESKFKIGGFAFSPAEMQDYYEYPTPFINPLKPRLGASVRSGTSVMLRRRRAKLVIVSTFHRHNHQQPVCLGSQVYEEHEAS